MRVSGCRAKREKILKLSRIWRGLARLSDKGYQDFGQFCVRLLLSKMNGNDAKRF